MAKGSLLVFTPPYLKLCHELNVLLFRPVRADARRWSFGGYMVLLLPFTTLSIVSSHVRSRDTFTDLRGRFVQLYQRQAMLHHYTKVRKSVPSFLWPHSCVHDIDGGLAIYSAINHYLQGGR